MALVRRNGRPYRSRSVRRGGRVTSAYRGSGPGAARLGAMDAARRAEEAAARAAWQAERERLDAQERAIVAWFDRVQELADTALVAAGYHRHKRQWRRRRG